MLYARDENDQQCLSFLLCWLHQLLYSDNKPIAVKGPSEMHMLDSLTNRAISQKQHHLVALCELKKAKCGYENGKDPILVFKFIETAHDLIIKHDLHNLESTTLLTKASLYKAYGDVAKSGILIKNLARNSTTDITADDHSLAYAHSAINNCLRGEYDLSLKFLQEAKVKFPVSHSNKICNHWIKALGSTLFQISFYR
jgi:hypothetical protein